MSVRERIYADELEVAHAEPGRFEPPHLRMHIDLVEPVRGSPEQKVAVTAFFIMAALWLGFLALMFIDGPRLTDVWVGFRDQSIVLRVVEGALLLPWVLGLAVWNTDWQLWVRYVVISGMALTTIYLFYPWKGERS